VNNTDKNPAADAEFARKRYNVAANIHPFHGLSPKFATVPAQFSPFHFRTPWKRLEGK